MLSADYWNNRYLNSETGWDIGHASPAIISFFEDIDRNATLLIPGCGNGYEGEILHQMGFTDLTLMDFAPEAKTNFLKRYPAFPEDQFLVGDFFALEGQFDYIVEQTFFCALVPEWRENYAEKMRSLLSPNGKLVGLMFDAPLNTDHPPFGGNKAEYQQLFSKHFSELSLEPCQTSISPRSGKELWVEFSNVKN